MKLPFHDKKFLYLLAAVAIAVVLEILSLTGIHIPFPYAPVIYGIFIVAVGYEVLWNGLKSLFKLNFGSINLLMLIAVVAAFYLKEYPEAAVVIVLYVLGEKLEDIGIENSLSALDNLVSSAPKTALVKATGENIPIEDVKTGTIIQVKPHDQIPLDGVVEMGETSVDESPITGEPIPAFKVKGDAVFAGTLNKNGFIEIKTTKEHKDSTFSKIVELTYQSQNNQSDSQKFIEKFAGIYTPIVILSAILLIVIPVFFMHLDFQEWLRQAITLLVISCPCALVISTPVAIYAAIGNASSKGALIKGGKFLEYMAEIKAIGLDKTRTITFGKPIVSDVIPLNGNDRSELLGCGAGTELFSEHPLAQAIVDASKKEGFEPHEVKSFESVVGEGAKAQCVVCNNETVLVGKIDFIEKHQKVSAEIKKIVAQLSAEGKTSVIVSCEKEIRGIIGLTDEIKPDSAKAIQELQRQGIETVMITGDNQQAAQYVANQVNIREVSGGLLPQDKAHKINELEKKYQSVAMVGDGVNDAPALAASTVGIAMGAAGSDTAIEIADIALMNDKLSLIPFLIRLAKKTVKTIQWNTFGAITVKILFILLAFFGYSNLVLAITADVGVTLVVILISLRLMNTK
ncbi:MAG: cation-translocating P-type ATPase [Candidatus Symbiothrix sp.]|jgi:Cd2+/Zn2+-exporting ATPase|nr:cation-translocating P-type ATPase [Candidatus Symbiothrix sp.]